MAQQWDVFVSYAHEDESWVQVLAENLHRAGRDVFFDRWEIIGGSLLAQRLQQGLAASNVVVAVVSQVAVGKPWWQEEFSAAMAGVVAGTQRLIPVLLDDVPLPPFVAGRVYVDFRHLDAPTHYQARFADLLRAVQGLPQGDRPARGEGIVVPPAAYRAEGPRAARLRIDRQQVVFSTADQESAHSPLGVDAGLRTLVWEVERARSRAGDSVVWKAPETAKGGVLHSRLTELGRALGARFLAGDAGVALAQEIARSPAGPLRLAVQVDDPELADLPWETLVLPGANQHEPLVLQRGVQLYRSAAVAEPVAIQVPGPLRILAVIASPDRGGGDLLDYEAELARILAVVDPTRREQDAYVRVLNWGSRAAIRQALAEERFHVLHISCHAQPGALILETDTGDADVVTAQEFVDDILVDDHGVPLVVLAGCSTALAARQSPPPDPSAGQHQQGEQALPGLARDLLHAGVPAVLAMTAPVTDRYATDLCAQLYQELARRPEPVALTELTTVRRQLEQQRRQRPTDDPGAVWAEWATPALFLAGPPLPLYRRTDGVAPVPPRPESAPVLGGMIRRVGDFVGRRTELRSLLRELRGGRRGVVLHGIGGIGKSSLAAQLVDQLGEQASLVVPIVGSARVDLILEQVRQRLHAHCLWAELPDLHPHRQLVAALIDATPPWEQRLALIRDVVLAELPILLVLDNAEDNLTAHGAAGYEFGDQQLAAFLAAWVTVNRTRLLVTSRYSFSLPDRAHRRLTYHHLGPLSVAETRKMIWRLPALDALTGKQRYRAYTDLGGHPRSLEYLDALLAGGQARFDDVADRLESALDKRGIAHPEKWLGAVAGDLDRALAETITLTVDDVLLSDLLARLDPTPLARRLLLGAAVYRQPIDRIGLAWQLAEIQPPPADPDRDQRMRSTGELIVEIHRSGTSASEVGLTEDMLQQWHSDWAQLRQPLLVIPPDLDEALSVLLTLGLIASLPSPDADDEDTAHYLVHRWTAAALAKHTDADELIEAHRRAAQFWHWRVAVWPQDRTTDIQHLLEARYHHHHAHDLDDALTATDQICQQLHTWGAWTWEEDLYTETLTWLPSTSLAAAKCTFQLGVVAQEQGDYIQAEQRYQTALTVSEELGNRAGIAAIYGQLGMVARLRGEYALAEQRYEAALEIDNEFGNRTGIATSYHELGIIAEMEGRYTEAEQRYRAALTINEQLGNRYGIASNHGQLGVLAQRQGYYTQAEQHYHTALIISEELGQQAGVGDTASNLGVLRTQQGRPVEGIPYNARALMIHLKLKSPGVSKDIYMLARQRHEVGDERFLEILGNLLDDDSVRNVIDAVNNFRNGSELD